YCSVFFHSQAFDSGGVQRLDSNHNLYSYYGWRHEPGDRSHRWDQGNYSKTGAGELWNQVFGLDEHSLYGSPQFVDSSLSQVFDPRLRPGSIAIGAGSNGSDIGAVAFTGVASVPENAGSPMPALAYPNPGRDDFAV